MIDDFDRNAGSAAAGYPRRRFDADVDGFALGAVANGIFQ